MNLKCTKKEFLEMVIGVILIGLGGGCFRWSGLGADPFTTMIMAMSNVLPISYGNLFLSLNIILLIPMLFVGKRHMNWGTILNMIGVGYVSDFAMFCLQEMPKESLIVRTVMMLIGLAIICVGVAIYIYPNKGVGPYDALQLIAMDLSKGKVSYQTARWVCDGIALVVAIVVAIASGQTLFEVVGVGTVCATFLIGVLVQKISEWLKQKQWLDNHSCQTAAA